MWVYAFNHIVCSTIFRLQRLCFTRQKSHVASKHHAFEETKTRAQFNGSYVCSRETKIKRRTPHFLKRGIANGKDIGNNVRTSAGNVGNTHLTLPQPCKYTRKYTYTFITITNTSIGALIMKA